MTTKESSKELKELSEILADARTRLARVIPELVEHDIVDYHLSNVSLALSTCQGSPRTWRKSQNFLRKHIKTNCFKALII